MRVNFDDIRIGQELERPELADMWGCRDWHALGRGVVTPAGDSKIILFITEENQETLTQYANHLEGDKLTTEGEVGHRTDDRIIASQASVDVIHLFHRWEHHKPFTYHGRVVLEDYKRNCGAKPSVFHFRLLNRK